MNVLLIGTDWSGLIRPIVDEFRNQGHDIVFVDHGDFPSFSYVNKLERVADVVSRMLLGYKTKQIRSGWAVADFLSGLFHGRSFDVVILTNPDIFSRDDLNLMRSHSKSLVLNLWDSVSRMPNNIRYQDVFDVVMSFDFDDMGNYGFVSTSNFIPPSVPCFDYDQEAEHDVFCVMSYSHERYRRLVNILDNNPRVDFDVYVYIDHERKRRYIKDGRVKIVSTPIFGDKLFGLVRKSKCILDIGYDAQAGLSFRIFESMKLNRKVITTNGKVKEMDFYSESDFFILDSTNKIDGGFFRSPYVKVSSSVVKKYEISSWVERLVSVAAAHSRN